MTNDEKYRTWGWAIYLKIEKHAKIPSGGYSSVDNVNAKIPTYSRDKQESFFLAETLKYLFLLFDDSRELIPLDRVVLNTEAHAFPFFPQKPPS